MFILAIEAFRWVMMQDLLFGFKKLMLCLDLLKWEAMMVQLHWDNNCRQSRAPLYGQKGKHRWVSPELMDYLC